MITSTSNGKVKSVIQLLGKSSKRKEAKSFVVEGIRMFEEAPINQIKEVYISETFLKKHGEIPKLKQTGYELVSDQVFAKMTDTKTPQGVLAVLSYPEYRLSDISKGEAPLIIILEDIQDPGNLGTILRTAEGAGSSGVIMSRNTVDIYNPKVIRSTMGSVYRVPFLYTDDLHETIKELKETGVKVYAAHLKAKQSYDEISYCEASAFLIGNEGNGLKNETAELADDYLLIPMAGEVESLNAAIATSVLAFEAARQRRLK